MRWNRRPIEDLRTMDALFSNAEREAALLGDGKPFAEHLVLAALDLPEDSAARVFARLGADPGDFRRALIEQHADALRSIGIEPPDETSGEALPEPVRSRRPLQTGASAREVFSKVVTTIRKDGSRIYGAYILLAAADLQEGTTPRTLAKMGIDRDALAAAARAEIDALNGVHPA